MKDDSQVAQAIKLLNKLQDISGTNAKIALLRKNDSLLLRSLLFLAYDPYTVFGLTEKSARDAVPSAKEPKWLANYSEFRGLLASLSERRITGGEAARAFSSFIERCTLEEAAVYKRILNKDLRIGMGATSINKAFPGLVKTFDVMLAKKFNEGKLQFPVAVEPKLNGIRCVFLYDSFMAVTRNGKRLDNFMSMLSVGMERMGEILLDMSGRTDWVFDGELVNPHSLEKTMEQVFRKTNVDTSGYVYHIFDVLTMDEFTGEKATPYTERRRLLRKLRWSVDVGPDIVFVPMHIAEDMDGIKKQFKKCRAEGYEGIMLKDPEAPYEQSRSYAWMKMKDGVGTKPKVDLDLKVVKLIEGTGKYVGSLGAVVCKYKGNLVKIGSGFSDSERKLIWKRGHVGFYIQVIAKEVTLKGSLRDPRFICFRPDKGKD